jgi:hypothetical protein
MGMCGSRGDDTSNKKSQKTFFLGGQHGGFSGLRTGRVVSGLSGGDALVVVALRPGRFGMDEAWWAIVESFDKYYCLFSLSF